MSENDYTGVIFHINSCVYDQVVYFHLLLDLHVAVLSPVYHRSRGTSYLYIPVPTCPRTHEATVLSLRTTPG